MCWLYGLSNFNRNSQSLGEETVRWFPCVVSTEVLMQFFSECWWNHTWRGWGHSHFVIHRFASWKCVVFFFCKGLKCSFSCSRGKIKALHTPIEKHTHFMIIQIVWLIAFKRNDTAENKKLPDSLICIL